MNKSKRMIYRLDPVNKPFYTYCLFYSKDKNDVTFTENSVFYVGKGKNVKILANRREREHIRESYQEEYFDFHKSRKIRLLESEGYFIMSKVLEEFNDEDSSYASEESGKSIDYLSKKYKCDKVSTIDPILKEAGIEKRSSKSEIWNNKEEILGLIENNWTYKQISQKYRVSIPLISKIINYDTRTLLLA